MAEHVARIPHEEQVRFELRPGYSSGEPISISGLQQRIDRYRHLVGQLLRVPVRRHEHDVVPLAFGRLDLRWVADDPKNIDCTRLGHIGNQAANMDDHVGVLGARVVPVGQYVDRRAPAVPADCSRQVESEMGVAPLVGHASIGWADLYPELRCGKCLM